MTIKNNRQPFNLINDDLGISNVEAAESALQPSEVDLRLVMEKCLDLFRENALNHHIRLSLHMHGIPDRITADENKIRQIMHNLLSSAVEFTVNGGEVEITADQMDSRNPLLPELFSEASNRAKKFVFITVATSRIGLNKEDFERVFGSIEQVEHSTDRTFKRPGPGLSIAAEFVRLHGGKIWAESRGEGHGSALKFFIPTHPSTPFSR